MAKYDSLLGDLGTKLSSLNRVLIALPAAISTDRLASALALSLALKNVGKQVTVVTEGTPTVANTNLFGIGEVANKISSTGAGNFVISLEGVVDSTGTMQTVPALEKLDWYPEGANLNLVFHVIPGQRFEPSKITSSHQTSGSPEIIFTLGATTLDELGNIYSANSALFTSVPVVNIDTSTLNSKYGAYNIVDDPASSLSEIVAHLMPSLGLSLDKDIASNLIAGIYEATANLTSSVNADTFSAVSLAMQAGATLPGVNVQQTAAPQEAQVTATQIQSQAQPQPEVVAPAPQAQPQNLSPFLDPSAQQIPTQPIYQPQPEIIQPQPVAQPQAQEQPQLQMPSMPDPNNAGFDLRQVFQLPQMPAGSVPAGAVSAENFTVPPVVNAEEPKPQAKKQPESSPEERPMAEYAGSSSPEMDSQPTPDWLVPKIFKGGNLG